MLGGRMRIIITESDRAKALDDLYRQIDNSLDTFGCREDSSNIEAISRIREAVSSAVPGSDDYKSRLMKYIPGEVVVLYLTLDGTVNSASIETSLKSQLLWSIFLILLFGTWLYLSKIEKVTKKTQLFISTIAFAIWVFTLGGPFASLSWYLPLYGAILLPLYTFFVAMIKPES
jgi:hypothetical protein